MKGDDAGESRFRRFLPHACGFMTALGVMRLWGGWLSWLSPRCGELIEVSGLLASTATLEDELRWAETFERTRLMTSLFGGASVLLGVASMVTSVAVMSKHARVGRLRDAALANIAFSVAVFAVERPAAWERTTLLRALAARAGDGPSGVDALRLLACLTPAPSLTAGQLALAGVALTVSLFTLREQRRASPSRHLARAEGAGR